MQTRFGFLTLTTLTTLTLATLAGAATAHAATTSTPTDSAAARDSSAMTAVIPPSEEDETTLTVENPRNVAVTIDAEDGDVDHRLGVVPAHGSATFVIPRWLVEPAAGALRIWVDPRRGVELATDPLDLTLGQHLGLRVPLR